MNNEIRCSYCKYWGAHASYCLNKSAATHHLSHWEHDLLHGNGRQELEDANNGIGDVRFHFRDGTSHIIKRVMVDKLGGDPNGHKSDTVGEFENGNLFHVPNVVWWEVV